MPRIHEIDSFSEKRDHMNDEYTNLGYDWRGNILRNSLSPEIFVNPMNDIPMRQIERMIEFLIEAARKVKVHYAWSFDKNTKLLN